MFSIFSCVTLDSLISGIEDDNIRKLIVHGYFASKQVIVSLKIMFVLNSVATLKYPSSLFTYPVQLQLLLNSPK